MAEKSLEIDKGIKAVCYKVVTMGRYTWYRYRKQLASWISGIEFGGDLWRLWCRDREFGSAALIPGDNG